MEAFDSRSDEMPLERSTIERLLGLTTSVMIPEQKDLHPLRGCWPSLSETTTDSRLARGRRQNRLASLLPGQLAIDQDGYLRREASAEWAMLRAIRA